MRIDGRKGGAHSLNVPRLPSSGLSEALPWIKAEQSCDRADRKTHQAHMLYRQLVWSLCRDYSERIGTKIERGVHHKLELEVGVTSHMSGLAATFLLAQGE